MTPEQRRDVIVTAAVRIARESENGVHAVSHGAVAKRCSIPTTARTVRHYFRDRAALWAATEEAMK